MSWFSLKTRRKYIIFLVFCCALAGFAYARKEIFFRQAKNLIKQNLEQSFPYELSIGRIKAGWVYGLALEDLRINFPQSHFGFAFNMEVEEASIDYNLWRNVFIVKPREDKRKDIQAIRLKGGRIYFGHQAAVEDLEGELLLDHHSVIFKDIKAAFQGNPQDALRLYGELSQEQLNLTLNLEHLKIGNFDLLTNFSLNLNKQLPLAEQAGKIYGTLKTYGSVLNNQPFPELSSSFEIQQDKLRILTFSLGDSYDLRGIINLANPFNVDLSLNFYRAMPHTLVSQFAFSQPPDFSGLINGLIKFTGPLQRPKVEGYLEAKDGHIGDLTFVSADINMKGRYPRISIVDSRICREEDSFLMEGEIDFSSLGQGLGYQDLVDIDLKAEGGMLWQGWDITRNGENQVHLSKNIDDDFKVTFDSFAEEASKDWQEEDFTNELGLEYRLFGDNRLTIRMKKDEGILGMEQRIKF